MNNIIIQTTELKKEYKLGNNSIYALNNVNLSIEKGSFIAITGKSGSGKTTLLNMIGGLDRPSSGEVIIDNKSLSSLEEKELNVFRRKKIGFVFQFFNLIPELNVRDNILFPVSIDRGIVDSDYFVQLIDLLELTDRLEHLPSELSGGQQQRVAVARALILKPEVLLLDEPTGNLDSLSSEKLIKGVIKLKNKFNQTIIIVTHDKDIANKAEQIIVLENGMVV